MRPNDMPRPFAPEHSGQHDLAETLRRLFAMSAPTDNAEVANDSPELECVFVNERPAVFFSTLREAADELARLRAEVAENKREIDELVRAVNLGSERAKKAERERDELRRRIAEADVAWIVGDDMFRSESEAIEEIRTWGPSDSIAQRVALVRLDAEEGK